MFTTEVGVLFTVLAISVRLKSFQNPTLFNEENMDLKR